MGENGNDNDGLQPNEVPGPDRCDASASRCEVSDPSDDHPDQCSFQGDDELDEAFVVEPIPVVMAPDGLPDIVEPSPHLAMAVPLSEDNCLCLEDKRTYVELFREELVYSVWKGTRPISDDNSMIISGVRKDVSPVIRPRSRYLSNGVERARIIDVPADKVLQGWGVSWFLYGSVCLPARPRRERCGYYRRQVLSNESQPNPDEFGHQKIYRSCTARRSNGGAYMSVGDIGVYACDYRSPPDLDSTREQDRKDQEQLQRASQPKV